MIEEDHDNGEDTADIMVGQARVAEYTKDLHRKNKQRTKPCIFCFGCT